MQYVFFQFMVCFSCLLAPLSIAFSGKEEPWDFSLMYTENEVGETRLHRKQQQENDGSGYQNLSKITLGGIAFVDKKHWSIWINNQMIDPEHPHPEIEICEVLPGSVSFRFHSRRPSAIVHMQINQTIDFDGAHYAEDSKKFPASIENKG